MELSELPRFKIRSDLSKDKQIVAFVIDDIVTNDVNEISFAFKNGKRCKLISKLLAELMAACDLGANWENLAKSPPLFGLDDQNICLVEGGYMPIVGIIEG